MRPSYQGMLGLLERGNAWVKISSGFRHPNEHSPDWSLPVEYAQDLLRRFGVKKVLWGSDSPFVGHEQVASYGMAIERFKLCVPDAGDSACYWRERVSVLLRIRSLSIAGRLSAQSPRGFFVSL